MDSTFYGARYLPVGIGGLPYGEVGGGEVPKGENSGMGLALLVAMSHQRAVRLELRFAEPPTVGARLEGLARCLRVGLKILHARVTRTESRYEIEVSGSRGGVEKALRALGGLA